MLGCKKAERRKKKSQISNNKSQKKTKYQTPNTNGSTLRLALLAQDKRAHGQTGKQAHGPTGKRVNGPTGKRVPGCPACAIPSYGRQADVGFQGFWILDTGCWDVKKLKVERQKARESRQYVPGNDGAKRYRQSKIYNPKSKILK